MARVLRPGRRPSVARLRSSSQSAHPCRVSGVPDRRRGNPRARAARRSRHLSLYPGIHPPLPGGRRCLRHRAASAGLPPASAFASSAASWRSTARSNSTPFHTSATAENPCISATILLPSTGSKIPALSSVASLPGTVQPTDRRKLEETSKRSTSLKQGFFLTDIWSGYSVVSDRPDYFVKLLDSLLDAIVRLEGDALVMHVGEKPYVVTASSSMNAYRGPLAWGQVELSSRVLTFDAVSSMLGQILPADQQLALTEFGAIEHESLRPPASRIALPSSPLEAARTCGLSSAAGRSRSRRPRRPRPWRRQLRRLPRRGVAAALLMPNPLPNQ